MEYRDDNLTLHDFITDYLSESNPAVFRQSANKWDSNGKWNNEFLRKNLGERKITVFAKKK